MNALVFVLASGAAAAATPSPAPPKPSPPPPATSTLQGSVKGPDAKPLAGAHVRARGVPWSWSEPPVAGVTAADGAFRLSLKGRGPFDVWVEARGFAARHLERVSAAAPLTVALARGGAIEGVVRDAESRVPLAGVRVEAGINRAQTAWDPDAGTITATTDLKGRFHLDGIGRGLYGIVARARGYATASRASVSAGGRVDLVLFPGSAIFGTTTGPRGEPIAEALILADAGNGYRTSARSDAGGRFELPGVMAGTYTLMARRDGFAPGLLAGVAVGARSDVEAGLRLGPAGRVIGRMLDADGKPLPGRVSARALGGAPVPRALQDVLATEAGGDGRFALDGLPLGSAQVSIAGRGHASRLVDVEVIAGTADLGDVILETGVTLAGRVHTRSGQPIADARLWGYARRIDAPGQIEGTTDSDGTFVLAGLDEGRYSLSVSALGYGGESLEVEAGNQNVDIVLQQGASVVGQVVDEAGRPVTAFQVHAQPERTASRQSWGSWKDVESDDGRFSVDDVTAGSFVLQVTAPNRPAATLSHLVVAPGATVDVGRVRLAAGGIVRGVVVDVHDAPVVGAHVTVVPAGQSDWSDGGQPGDSDVSGAFEVTGVPTGPVTVVANHPSYAVARTEGVTADPAKGPADARVVMHPGARLEGTVRGRDQTSVFDARVQVMAGGVGGSSDDAIMVAPDGTFAADHLSPGPATVLLMHRAGNVARTSESRNVSLRDGETTTVEFRSDAVLVAGRVSRGGAALPRSRLRLDRLEGGLVSYGIGDAMTPAGPQHMTATTAEDGSYEMIADNPGAYRMTAETADGRVSLPTRNVTIPDVESYALDLDFAGVPLGGITVDAETEQPIAEVQVSASLAGGSPSSAHALSGPDGRFQLEVDPGHYRVGTRARAYASQRAEVDVGDTGADIRLSLSHGHELRGRVVDAAGRAIPQAAVIASATSAAGVLDAFEFSQALDDGSFQYPALEDRPYALCAGNEAAGFGVRTSVTPGGPEVVLTQRRPLHLQLLVKGPDGRPLPGASIGSTKLDGASVSCANAFGGSDDQGRLTTARPPGRLEIAVSKGKLAKTITLAGGEDETVSAEVTLEEKKQ